MDADRPLIGDEHLGDELEERRLALAVAADHADRLTLPHLEGDVAQGPELARSRAPRRSREEVLEAASGLPVAPEADAGVVDREDGARVRRRERCLHQISFRTAGRERRKTSAPTTTRPAEIAALTPTAYQSSSEGKNAAR